MTHWDRLAREATTAALRVRMQLELGLDRPVCPYGIAEDLRIEVRFEPLPSLEGMYSPQGPVIVLGSMRPRGRRAYSCAHEIGHHVFGHGFQVDQLLAQQPENDRASPVEYIANRFAAALLMPKLAVDRAFAERGWLPSTSTPEQVFRVACALGVGYATLVGYMERTLKSISSAHSHALTRHTPKSIRRSVLGTDIDGSLVIMDSLWGAKTVDIEVGDVVVPPIGFVCTGSSIRRESIGDVSCIVGVAQGVSHIAAPSWHGPFRVSKKNFRGINAYRHLEDTDDDD